MTMKTLIVTVGITTLAAVAFAADVDVVSCLPCFEEGGRDV